MEHTYSTPFQPAKIFPAHWPRRWVIAAIVGVLVIAAAFWWAPVLSRDVQAAAARRKCLAYLPPQNQVVFEEDPNALTKLQGVAGYDVAIGGRLRWVPRCWAIENPTLKSQGTVFLHSRTSAAGHVRLVGVDISIDPGLWRADTGNVEDISLVATVIIPATGLGADRPVHIGQTVMWICPADPKPMRFYGGRPDPADAARFSFDYQRSGTRASIDGRLNDDDSVTLSPCKGTVSHARQPLMWEPDGSRI